MAIVYFGGCERPNAIHTLAKAGGKRVMVSFAEPPSQTCWELYRQYGIEIMADSGAFSAWKRGTEIDLNDYIAWIRKNNIELYFNMDVVGDPISTEINQRLMENAGLYPIPVFHYGEPWSYLDKLSKHEYIGLGGTVGLSERKKRLWLQQVYTKYPDKKFHALGLTGEKFLRGFPLYSVDSTWWLYKFRDNDRRLAPGEDRKIEQQARVRHLLGLQGFKQIMYQTTLSM